MAERGVRLIAREAITPRVAHSSAQLGLTLRSVLLSPKAGFGSVFAATQRRAKTGTRPAEGVAPYVLAGLGGVALMAFWLKAGSLFGVREVAADQFRWSYLVVAALGGALLGVLAQLLWGHVGAGAAKALGASATPRELRIVWGASAFPQVVALIVLIPLDLLIVGPATFTSERLQDSLATGWAALSIALSASLAVWSAFIFVRGVEVAASLNPLKALVASLIALVCFSFVTTVVAFALSGAGS